MSPDEEDRLAAKIASSLQAGFGPTLQALQTQQTQIATQLTLLQQRPTASASSQASPPDPAAWVRAWQVYSNMTVPERDLLVITLHTGLASALGMVVAFFVGMPIFGILALGLLCGIIGFARGTLMVMPGNPAQGRVTI